MVRRYLIAIIAAMYIVPLVQAQPVLNFKRIDATKFPDITLYYKASCNGKFANNVGPQNFEVYENGMPVGTFDLYCPPEPDCCISVALVLDRSFSMTEFNKMENLKIGAHQFIDQLGTGGYACDEAAIVMFNTTVTLLRPMTKNKFELHQGIEELVPEGKTAVWDASVAGIKHLDSTAMNHCRAVVVISDGGDNSSAYRIDEVIGLAQDRDVKVFTIGYGDNMSAQARFYLQRLAEETGGLYYYAPVAESIVGIFESMRETIRDSYQECTIRYTTGCPDGRNRVVDLKLVDFCGGSDIKTGSYIAPLNTGEWNTIEAKVGSGTVVATQLLEIPVTVTNAAEGVFAESNFQINYNTSYLTFDHAEVTGTMLEGVTVSAQPTGSGVRIFTYDKLRIQGPGTLIRLYFRAADVANAIANSPFDFVNWSFDGYCLIPRMTGGEFGIVPRSAELTCSASSPSALRWDDFNKEYTPNPFEVAIRVDNNGTREASGVYGIIRYDPTRLELLSPAVDRQDFIPGAIAAGGRGEIRWVLRAKQLNAEDTVTVCIDVYSSNPEPLSCCRTILVNPATLSAIACDITAPDTVYFREQYYEPETFDVRLGAKNTGKGMARDVIGQLLQDTRFTKLTSTRLELADRFMPGDTAEATFTVQMIPRQTDGYDTVWAQVQGADGDPAWCYHPVWVERVRSPKFSLLCTTPQNQLQFDENTGEYVPNPFIVTTAAENIGETYAEECQIMFVGPQSCTPIGDNPRPIGYMGIGDTDTRQWVIRALPRAVDGWDTLHFQILGKGGLGRNIVLTDCFLPVFVPATRKPIYEIVCDAPDTLSFDGIQYSPNPFVYSVTITNTGAAPGFDINPKLSMPGYMSLESGTLVQNIPQLLQGESKSLTWTVRCDKRLQQDYATMCVVFTDSGIISNQCCVEVFVPGVHYPDLGLTCATIDTLHASPTTGEYVGNPFEVRATVVNNGAGIAVNARVSIRIEGTHVALIDPPPVTVQLGNIAPGGSRNVVWFIQAQKRPDNATIPITVTLVADETSDLTCSNNVFIPSYQTPLLTASCWTAPEDSLFFDWGIGDFAPSVCEVGIEVSNIGFLRAENVSVLLIPPDGVVLADGEANEKYISDPLLEYGERSVLVWRVRASRDNADRDREFRFVARADNAAETYCDNGIWVQGSPKVLTLSLPRDVLFRFGQKAYIPVSIDRTIGKDLSSYSFTLEYDPAVLSVLDVSNIGTLTGLGWVGARMRKIDPGKIEISDYTTGTPVHTEAGTLVNIYAEGVFMRTGPVDDFGYSELAIDPAAASLSYGDIEPRSENGSIYVTNECIEPLAAGDGFALAQNRPNPFNPSTEITFAVPYDTYVRITVFDKMGRDAGLAAEGLFKAGQHTVGFDAKHLPSGIYFYRMEAGGLSRVRKMILAR